VTVRTVTDIVGGTRLAYMPNEAFTSYFASAYDEIYKDKAYAEESEYVQDVFSAHGAEPEEILDLGCGSGGHAVALAASGYNVHGIDKSEKMVQQVNEKISQSQTSGQISVERGDITTLNLDSTFEGAIAMFSVMSYLIRNEDIEAGLRRVGQHLEPGSLFIFDTWYGPAVLGIRPEPRLKTIDTGKGTLYRYATPTMRTDDNVVELKYDVLHVNGSQVIAQGSEVHPLRYFFKPDIEFLSDITGFELLDVHPFQSMGDTVDEDTWNVSWVLKKE
jgi:SAM-dependent methyltransferase